MDKQAITQLVPFLLKRDPDARRYPWQLRRLVANASWTYESSVLHSSPTIEGSHARGRDCLCYGYLYAQTMRLGLASCAIDSGNSIVDARSLARRRKSERPANAASRGHAAMNNLTRACHTYPIFT